MTQIRSSMPQGNPTAEAAITSQSVAILMATYNGVSGLPDQLTSIATQDHINWSLMVSDDGSKDATRDIVSAFASNTSNPVTLLDGPRQGAAANFMSLVRHLADNQSITQHLENSPCLAFSDQDDVWLPDRLSRGLSAIAEIPADTPALFCSRTWITDASTDNRRLSRPRPRAPSFRNALVQNIASGNTILLNPAATQLICDASRLVGDVVVHDWWVYQLVTGAGGVVVHDDTPTLLYRQHGDNIIGANDTTTARFIRVWQLLRGDFKDWNTRNIAALKASEHLLTPNNLDLLNRFEKMRHAALPSRMSAMRGLGLYRQTGISTLALWLSSLVRRI